MTIRVWEAATGDCVRTLRGHLSDVMCLAVSTDGKLIASGGAWDGTMRVWDGSSGELLAVFEVGSYIRSLAFSPDNKLLIAGCSSGRISIWDAEILLL